MLKSLAIAIYFLILSLFAVGLRPVLAENLTSPGLANFGEQIVSFDSQIVMSADSSIDVQETIVYNLPPGRHGIYRYIPFRYRDETAGKNFITPVDIKKVTDSGNQPWPYEKAKDGNNVTLKIGDSNKTLEGLQTYKIHYQVSGVINYFETYDELYWNVTGDKWEAPIGRVTADVTLPIGVNLETLQLGCYTGPIGSKETNCQKSQAGGMAKFSSDAGPLTIVVGVNKDLITPIARQYEEPGVFSKLYKSVHHESGWWWLVFLASFILLLVKYFRTGRDPFGRGTIAPEFEPPEGLRPGEMGTLLDERADRQDITATIIDLAVRRYLKIKERDKKKYTLIKLKEPGIDFKDYEKKIFEEIFSGRQEVNLEDIHKDFSVGSIEDKLYDNVVGKKYFIKNPDAVRSRSCALGLAIMIFAGIFLVVSWNLVFAVFFSGILVLIFGRSTPKKTRDGVIAKEKSLGFREFLYRAERYRVKWQEKEGIFEKFLPYAMIFGIAEVWAKNFQDIYKKPPDWYEGDFATFSIVAFASSLNSFSNTASSSYSPPPSTSASSGSSGFGGGGSSGGGFGGGGGGSW